MSRFFLTIIALFLFANATFADFTGQVVGVTDGDTIKVMHNGAPEKIRFAGIDCPEHNQAFGQQAKQFTASECFGQIVTIQDRSHDKYGRTIGEVITSRGRDVNHDLVTVGLAWWYRQYAPNDIYLQQIEGQARFARRGLWSDSNAMPPWEFRKQEKATRRWY